MVHTHIETITFGTCLVIFARAHTHTHTHARTHFDVGTGTVGLPSLQALVGGERLCLCHTFFRGGLENYLGCGGGGLNSGVWEGVLFFVSQVVFLLDFVGFT